MLFHSEAIADVNISMNMEIEKLVAHILQHGTRMCWWQNVKASEMDEHGMSNVLSNVRELLLLLQQIDNATMNIVITIKKKQ